MVRNQRITFLKKKSVTRDELGQERIEWADTGITALAKVSPVSGKLYYEAARVNEENTLLFRLRYAFIPKDFNRVDYCLLYNGSRYIIKQFSDVDARHYEVQLRGESV